jgi:hypothetical protein
MDDEFSTSQKMSNDVIITCYEKIDIKRIIWLLSQKVLNRDTIEDAKIRCQLKSHLKALKTGRYEIKYFSTLKLKNYGRIYGHHYPTEKRKVYGSLGSYNRFIRSFLASPTHLDIDIEKCHWYILRYLFQQFNIETKIIDDFLEIYPIIVNFIKQNNLYSQFKPDDDDKMKSKKTLFSILNCSPNYLKDNKKKILDKFEILKKIHNVVYGTLITLLQNEYQELYKIIFKEFKTHQNINGKFLSHTLQDLERINILRIIEFFRNKNIDITTIIHDGFLIRIKDEEGFEEKVLNVIDECHKYLEENFNIKFNLEIKPFIEHNFTEPPEDFDPLEEDDITEYKYLCNKLLSFALENNLRKDEIKVYQRSNTHPMVYHEYCKEFRLFLEIVFKNDNVFDSKPCNYDNMIKFINQRNKDEFSNIELNYDWFAFKNGAINIKTREFLKLEEIDKDTKIIARNYFDKDFDPNGYETPLLDGALLHQLKDKNILNILYGLTGRTFFPVGYDNFQCTPLLWGDPSKFKSGYLNPYSLFFKKIGTITSSYEKTFGLSGLENKEVVISFDLPKNFHHLIDESDFKNMVDGQLTNVPTKFETSRQVKWNVPMIGASNYTIGYGTSQVYKRLATFMFFEEVLQQDTELESNIIEKELMNFLNKCIREYHILLKNKGTFEAWSPQYFKDSNKEMDNLNSSFKRFLDSDEYIDKFGNKHGIILNPSFECKFDELENWYKKWCSYTGNKSVSINRNVLIRYGLDLVKKRICRFCKKHHLKNCCEHYNRTASTTKNYVKGLKLQKIEKTYFNDDNESHDIEEDL